MSPPRIKPERAIPVVLYPIPFPVVDTHQDIDPARFPIIVSNQPAASASSPTPKQQIADSSSSLYVSQQNAQLT